MSEIVNDGWDDFGEDLKNHFLADASAQISKFVTEDKEFSTTIEIKEFLTPLVTEWQTDAAGNQMHHFAKFLKAFETALKSASTSEIIIDTYLNQLNEYLLALKNGEPDSEERFKNAIKIGKGKQLFLHCYTGDHEFVVPIQHVLEVTTSREIYPLPDGRKEIAGMLSFRGESVPVINLDFYGFHGNKKEDATFFVICDFVGLRFALEVTKTADVLDLTDLEMQELNSSNLFSSAAFVSQFVNRNDKTILVFDLEKLVAA